MPRVAELISDRAVTRVPLDTGTLTIAYKPRMVTTAWQQNIGALEAAGAEQSVTLFAPIRETIIEWDLTDDDDKPYPFTDEALAKLPRQVLTNVLLAVVASARPNPEKLLGQSTDGSSGPSTLPTPTRISSRRTGTS